MLEQPYEYWTVKRAAKELGVNYKTLYGQLNTRGPVVNGIAIAVQISHTWKCLPEAIARVRGGETGNRERQTA